MQLEIRELKQKDENAFYEAIQSFKKSDPDFTFAFRTEEKEDFVGYLKLLEDNKNGKDLGGFVANSFLVAVIDEKIAGRVNIRHELNDHLLIDGGHIGYGVVKEFRGKGIAKALLNEAIAYCKNLGIKEILITVDEDNPASQKVIESVGVTNYETKQPKGFAVAKRYYWIRS